MCQLCSESKIQREHGKDYHLRIAEDLKKIAGLYDALAYGTMKPHSDDVVAYGSRIKGLIKEFVENWI